MQCFLKLLFVIKGYLKKFCCVHDFFQMNPIKKGHLERTCRECIDLTWSQNLQKKPYCKTINNPRPKL